MAKSSTSNGDVQLKLSTTEAVKQIETLQKSLTDLKTEAKKKIPVEVTVDTKQLDDAAKKVKDAVNSSLGSKTSKSKVADLTQISKQLDKIAGLLQEIVTATGALNTELQTLNGNVSKMGAHDRQIKQLRSDFDALANSVGSVNNKLQDGMQKALNFASTSARVIAQVAKGAEEALGTYRNFGQNLLTGFTSFASSVLETVGFGVTNLVDDAIEQERKLQQAQIGFRNMFPGQDVSAMVQQVRTTAATSPGLNSGDLADYINQLGAVSGGDFSTAFNATMGILKTVQYGGGDAASQMTYIIKNIRDVMAKGKATQIDVQQFNRAMPLLQKSLAAIGASEFLKDGELKITKENAANLMNAFAALNTEDNPAYTIFDETAKTLAGLQEEFRETVSSQIATMMEGLGFFDTLSKIMRDNVFPEIDKGLQELASWLRKIMDAIDWGAVGNTALEVLDGIKVAIGEFGAMIREQFGNTEFLQLAVKTVGAFFEGLINGATELGKFIAWLKDTMGEEGFTNLAKSLGQALTQGAAFQALFSGIANSFGAAASALQSAAFGRYLLNNKGGGGAGGGGISAGLGTIVNALSGGSVSKNAAAGVFSKIGAGASKVLGRAGAGTVIGLLTDGVADAVQSLNLFGDKTTAVANIIDVSGNSIQWAVYGSILGPFGALGGAAIGLVQGLEEAKARLAEKEAKETAIEVKKIKVAGGQEVLDATIQAFRSAGGAFDEETDAAAWVKNQMIDYLNETPVSEWNDEVIYDKFLAAYRQKLGHERMVDADNLGGFWELQGNAIEYFDTNDKGEKVMNAYGVRLAKLIRDYNLVGYNSISQLENTPAESLIREYLATESINEAQLTFLEQQAKEFESTTGEALMGTTDTLKAAVKKVQETFGEEWLGAVDDIKNVIPGWWQNFSRDVDLTTLEMYEGWTRVTKKIQKAFNLIGGEVKGDTYWEKSTAEEILGKEGAEKYEEWRNRNYVWDMLNPFSDLRGVGAVYNTVNPTEIIPKLFDVTQDPNTSEEVSTAINEFFKSFNEIDEGDLKSIRDKLLALARIMVDAGELGAFGAFGELGPQGLSNTLKLFGYAGGGRVRPIFRAGGGTGSGVDTVPAFLQPGEFVQRASAVNTAGLGVMNALNNGDLASAYRMIGSKISGSWNNSRTTNNTSDSRSSVYAPTYNIFGRRMGAGSLAQAIRV